MATRNIAPVNDNEGNIGTSSKKWSKGWFHALHVAGNLDDGPNTVTIAQMKDLVDGHADLHEVGGSGEIDVRGLQGGWLTADTEANRPAAGTKDRYFYATDTGKLYYDNGTSWVEITPTPAEHGNEAHIPDMLPLSTSSAIDAYMSGNKWLSVATSGIVGLPKQSACYLYQSTQQTVATDTETTVTLDAKELDIQNEGNTTTSRFTATEDGLYLVLGAVGFHYADVVADKEVWAIIVKNGSSVLISITQTAASSAGASVRVAGVLELTSGDYLELRTKHIFGANARLVASETRTYLIALKIA